jgi:PKD repeat protein
LKIRDNFVNFVLGKLFIMKTTSTFYPAIIIVFLNCILFSLPVNGSNDSYTVTDDSHNRDVPSSIITWNQNLEKKDGTYSFTLETPITYTCFGIGWKSSDNNFAAGNFKIHYRIKDYRKVWTEIREEEGYIHPENTPTGLYWTDLIFGVNEKKHYAIEFTIVPPENIELMSVRVDIMDFSDQIKPMPASKITQNGKACPEIPSIIPRSEWCGGYSACHNPTYTPATIYPTHTVIHHGASPDEYTDSYAVVRGYWNYHVNSNGWSDIGYNYLFDKYGNMFQGRHNLNMPNVDVRGAHAGASNDYSIGINFLGNADVTQPTAVQLSTVQQFLAWWYNKKGFDPTSMSNIVLQSGGSGSKYRICGHKDVNVGGTSCPGSVLYAQLGSIRTATKAIIDACNMPIDNTPPTTSIIASEVWKKSSFDVLFDDLDNTNGSGIDYSFYQVLNWYDNQWRANGQNGFFNDNFTSAIHPDWSSIAGTWSIVNSRLNQSNESLSNTNIYASVNQTAGNTYLYHWQMKISGSSTTRRAGMHFFCSDATQSNRENNYMVYFRADDNKVQIYKYTNNNYSLNADQSSIVDTDIWYDCKVLLNTNTGLIKVYQNNTLVASWTDPSPLQSGNAISLRTGDCSAEYDDVKVLKSRGNSVIVTVGNNNTNDIFNQSPNSTTDACRIKSLVKDIAENWSADAAFNAKIDWERPVTQISTTGQWKTGDFDVNFIDFDSISSIDRRFYQVLDFDGTNWGANTSRGFLGDNFDVLNTNLWSIASGGGAWSVSVGNLIQSDEAVGNSNIFAPLNQTLSNRYLYHFTAKCEGTGTNRRFGFHFFADDATLTNRGNSYFIWFRLELQTLEFYKVVDDVFTQEEVVENVSTNAGQYYDFKVIYDRITGEIIVYRDNIIIGSWTDPSPYSSNGNYISFRSGNSKLSVNEIKVYRTRYPSLIATVGTMTDDDIRFQNTASNQSAAKIKSIVCDIAGNLSEIAYHDLNIDWTPPTDIATVNDGNADDIDYTSSNSSVTANWSSSVDTNSDVLCYWYSIGTEPGLTDIVDWTNNGTAMQMNHSGLNLTTGITYYVNVKSENFAGLMSSVTSSDGVVLSENTTVGFATNQNNICVGETVSFTNSSLGATSYLWSFEGGIPATSTDQNPEILYPEQGSFSVSLIAYGVTDTVELNIPSMIITNPMPVASFTSTTTQLNLPNALALFTNNSTNANSYLWDFGDGQTSVEFEPWHIYTSVGHYTVSLIAFNNLCGNDTIIIDSLIKVDTSVGFVENIISESSIYPNPFNNNITIDLSGIDDLSCIEIVDVYGTKIRHLDIEQKIKSGRMEINMSDVASGIYFIRTVFKNQISNYKLIKE